MGMKKKQTVMNFTVFVVLPLVVVNHYAYSRVSKSSEHWLSTAFSLSEPLSQLAIVLVLNIAVIVVLLAIILSR